MTRTPRLLLSTEALVGVTRHPRERTLAVRRELAAPEALAHVFEAALGRGAEGLLVSPTPVAREAIARLGRAPIHALVPNVPQYARDAADLGLIGTALKRVRGASLATLARLGITGVTHAPGVLANDFAGLVPLLLELECAALGAKKLESVVLAATLTDLALAGGHARLFRHLVGFIRSRFGARAGFETHNLGHLLSRLREWEVRPDFVIGPVNPRGFLMKPDPSRVLAALADTTLPVLAKEVRAGGTVELGAGVAYAMEHGASGVVVDLVDLERGVEDLPAALPLSAGAEAG